MQFDSLAFIAFFLTIGLYWSISSWVWRKICSCSPVTFYAGRPYFLPLLIVTSFLDRRPALLVAQRSIRSRKIWLAAICVVNLQYWPTSSTPIS